MSPSQEVKLKGEKKHKAGNNIPHAVVLGLTPMIFRNILCVLKEIL